MILLVAVTLNAYAQQVDQNVTVTIKPSQTVEQRVADSIKEKELREV
jgi:cell division protein FtsX